MKDFGKKLLGFAFVAIVSSGISIATYSWLEKSGNQRIGGGAASQEAFAKPVTFSNAAVSSALETDFTQAAENTVNAVVGIKSTVRQNQNQNITGDPFFDFFFGHRGGNAQPQPKVGFGSGVIVSSDGYIVTNNHVVDGSDEVEITLNDKRTFNARVVGTDPATDLALLKIEAEDLPIVKFGDSDNLKVGEWVLAVGNPFQLTSTVTAGIVSAKARSIGIISNQQTMGIESFIQTDAAVNPGNSGGALVNTRGELVGINTAIYSQTGNFAGYSFAVPSSIVSKVITDLKQYGAVQRAVLGVMIRDINAELAKEKDLTTQSGAYVEGVNERSAALEAGIEKGDIIVAVNNVPVKTVSALQEQVNRYRPGDKIKVTVLRGKQNKDFTVTLKNYQGNTEVTKVLGMDVLGAAFKEVNPETKRQLGIRTGIQVTGIKKGKFQNAGIRDGFIVLRVNDQAITSVQDMERVFDSIMKNGASEKVMFIAGVYPNGKTGYYAVDLTTE